MKERPKFEGRPRSQTGKWVGPWLPHWRDRQDGGPFSQLKTIYDELQASPDGLRSKRAALEASGKYTTAGITDMLRDMAVKETVPAIRKAAAERLRKFRRNIETRRAAMKPFDHDPADLVGELRRQEVRQWLRGLKPAERTKAVRHASDPAIVEAAISVPAELTGLEASTREDLSRQLVEQRYGAEIAALNELDEAVKTVERAADGARDDVRETLGLTEPDFNAEFGPVEDEIDRVAALKLEKDRATIDLEAVAASVKDMSSGEREELIERIRREGDRADHRTFMDGLDRLSGKAA